MQYEASLQTISWFNEHRMNARLEISPHFQRRAVWLERERSELMETICSNLPFPEIYIHVVTDRDTGGQKYIVVDGQQRLTSIFRFIDNEFGLPNNNYWDGQNFRDLSDEQKEAFWDYKVVVRSLRRTNDTEIRDLFERLNTNNIALNDQEIRNAKYRGAFKKLALRLADDSLFQEMGLFTARDVRRMLDVEFIGELLVLVIHGISNKKDLLDSFYAQYDEEFPGEADYETLFTTALGLFWSIYETNNRVLFKTKSNFYTLFGCMIKYFKATGNRSFINPHQVQQTIIELIDKARNQEFDDNHPEIEEYADAVSRAASDRGRRIRREDILWERIAAAEGIS
ncbi:MAG: DUF262 domain-containing protein [Candidatus Thiodiazotropha sp. (ex. Lucinisca nassula)]|nr:DUF262 domain-containing protein [Candidatus Thiodiazotropha sp. (ex. Lucinisca nassula)]